MSFWTWMQGLGKGVSTRKQDEPQDDLLFEIELDRAGVLVDGRLYLTLSQAILRLRDAAGKAEVESAISILRQGLVCGSLTAIVRSPAPQHDDRKLTGSVVLESDFWDRVWWPGIDTDNIVPTDNWIGWLFSGGVVVPLDAIDELAERLRPEPQNDMVGVVKGRPRGTGHQKNDIKFVEMALQLRRDGVAKSATEAAQMVVDQFNDKIDGASPGAKKERIRKQVKRLENNGQ